MIKQDENKASTVKKPAEGDAVTAQSPTPEQILDIAARLRRVRHTPSSSLIREFCLPANNGEASKGVCGCSKFHTCSIHPQEQKSWTIAQIKKDVPSIWAKLKEAGCLRCHLDEMPEIKTLLKEGKLAAGDFYAALTKNDPTRASIVARKLGAHHCANHYCAVPELLDVPLSGGDDAVRALATACPIDKVRLPKAGEPLPANRHRLLACRLTWPAFVALQKQLGVCAISPTVLLPGDMEQRAQIVYAGKNVEADFQFLSIDPASLHLDQIAEFPQAQLRLHAPLLVRHHFGSEARPDHLGGQRDTLKWLADRNDPSKVSPLEWSQQCRYIPSGEFTFLLLMWFWTGEPSTAASLAPGEARKVCLEKKLDAGRNGSPMLLQMLTDLGLGSEIREVFGTIKQESESWIRSSTRLEDFISLGLIAPQDSGAAKLTEKTAVFARWLKGAVDAISTTSPQPANSPYNVGRLRALLLQKNDPGWLEVLDRAANSLLSACAANDANAFADSLCNLLDGFYNQVGRYKLREKLRIDGFPVYPVVHLTMLLGIPQPLDWLALPLGGTVVGDENPELDSLPQGAAYVLSIHREPCEIPTLVHALITTLEIPVSAYASQWAEHVITETRRELAAVTAALAQTSQKLVYASPAMAKIVKEVSSYCQLEDTILIRGKTGTGKRALAEAIHEWSGRLGQFYKIFLPGIAPTVAEGELFGWAKGGHDKAEEERPGLVECAEGGTLFLDEIGDLDPHLQTKLLDFLESKQFRRMGENRIRTASVRIIAATNAPLEEKVGAGSFREDLYHRLAEQSITIPPLSSRPEDIELLFKHFAEIRAVATNVQMPAIDTTAITALKAHPWPGNVRELMLCARRAVTIAVSDRVAISKAVIEAALLARDATNSTSIAQPAEDRIIPGPVVVRPLPELAAMDSPPFDESVAGIKRAWKPDDGPAKHWRLIPASDQQAIREIVKKLARGDANVIRQIAEKCGITLSIFRKYAV